MFGAIEGAHSGIALVPYADVEQIIVDVANRRSDVVHMAPVHTNEVDRPIARDRGTGAQRVG